MDLHRLNFHFKTYLCPSGSLMLVRSKYSENVYNRIVDIKYDLDDTNHLWNKRFSTWTPWEPCMNSRIKGWSQLIHQR